MVDQNELMGFLKKSDLFHNLSEEEFQLLIPLIRTESFDKDLLIVKEEEKGEALFLIKTGIVEILKKDKEHQIFYRLALLQPGDSFGEMAILGTKTRMASAKALEKTEVVILDLKDFERLAEKSPAFSKISMNIAKKGSKQLEIANETTVKLLKEELRLTKTHDQMSRFIIYLFILLTFFVYTLKFFEQYGSYSPVSKLLVSCLILCFGVSGALLVKRSGYPLEFYGLSLKNWKKNSIEAVFYTIPILILMVGIKWFVIKTIPAFSQLSVFEFGNRSHSFLHQAFNHLFGKPEKQINFHIVLFFYVLLVPVQEFIARGCLQSSLRNFFTTANGAFLAILTSNLLFGLFHGLKSFTFALCAFLLGIFWGSIYERQRTIVGPSVSHILVGIWAFGVLNYQSILIF
jgi:CRP/FNR family cyclic AMP-dependent transcriptional regulator